MKKVIQLCDRCGTRECPYESFYVEAGEQRTLKGEFEPLIDDVDLCPICLRAVMDHLIQQMTIEQRRSWITLARLKSR